MTKICYVTPDSERSHRAYVKRSAGGDMELSQPLAPADRELKRDIVIEQRRSAARSGRDGIGADDREIRVDQEVSVRVARMADIAVEEIEISSTPRWAKNDACFCGSSEPLYRCHGTAIY